MNIPTELKQLCVKYAHNMPKRIPKNEQQIFKEGIELYRSYGFNVTNNRNLIWLVLNKVSHPVVCPVCDKQTTWLISKKQYATYCSVQCQHQSEEVKIKTKQTFIEKYGVDHPRQNIIIIINKTKQTNLTKYGSTNYLSSEQGRQHILKSLQEKYGIINPSQINWVQEKKRINSVVKYGVSHPSKHHSTKEKQKQTNLKRYGTPSYAQQHMKNVLRLLENYDWLYEQYIIQNKTAEIISEELNIWDTTVGKYLKKHEITIKYIQGFSIRCCIWLNSIMEKERIYIQHALNGGEYQIPGTRYKADGYCEETNTIYEFHGDLFHGNPKIFNQEDKCHPFDEYITANELYQKTIERENLIKSMGYNLITIWEGDWMAAEGENNG